MKTEVTHKISNVEPGETMIEGLGFMVPPDMADRWVKELSKTKPLVSGYPLGMLKLSVQASAMVIVSKSKSDE